MAATSGATDLHNAITGLFDAIRSKAGVSGSMTFAEAASVVGSITGGDGMTTVQKLVNGWALPAVPQEEADAITEIPTRAFYNCITLTTASFPACTTIGLRAFYSCIALTTASFPACTYVRSSAFANCFALTTAYFPSLTSIPNAARTGKGVFEGCSALIMISLPACSAIGSAAFRSCISLMSLYLMRSLVTTLNNTTAFTNTPLSAGGSGTIYVPSSLWSSYLTARNWSTLSSKIVSM